MLNHCIRTLEPHYSMAKTMCSFCRCVVYMIKWITPSFLLLMHACPTLNSYFSWMAIRWTENKSELTVIITKCTSPIFLSVFFFTLWIYHCLIDCTSVFVHFFCLHFSSLYKMHTNSMNCFFFCTERFNGTITRLFEFASNAKLIDH